MIYVTTAQLKFNGQVTLVATIGTTTPTPYHLIQVTATHKKIWDQ